MANNKKTTYMTVDQIRKQERENRFKNLKFDDDKIYSVDEIRQAAINQGLIKPPEPTVQTPSAQPTSRPSPTNQFDLKSQIARTQNEVMPQIAKRAIEDYNNNRLGYENIAKYDDTTRYSDVKSDIDRLKTIKGGAARRGRDTAVYDRAIDMLKNYSKQNYSLESSDLSADAIQDRRDIYADNAAEIENLNKQLSTASTSQNAALQQWLDYYDDNTIITDEDNQYIIDNIKNDTGYDLSETLGGLDSAERQAKAEELRALAGQDDSQERKRIQDRIEALTAQNTAYERTQKKSDDYADLYRDKAKEEEKDPYGLLSGSLHTRNMVPKDYYESVEGKDNPLFTESGDLSQPMIKRFEDSPAASSAYKNIDAHTEMLTADEKEIYSYLLRNKSELEAKAYIDELKDTLQKRYNDSVAEYIDDANGVEKAILLASSVPMNVYGSVTGFAEDAINMATGGEIHPYSEAHAMYNIGQQTRSAVANDIDEATGGANVAGFSLGDAFQAAMSIPDFMLGSLTPEFYVASMSMGAAQSRAKELWEEGASYDQIVSESVLTGAAEAIFEEVSLDKIVKMAKGGSLKDYITTALKGMAIEGSEEVNTEIANILTDVIVRGSQSDWGKTIQKYIDEGYSEEEAKGLALGDMVKQVGYAGVGGMIGGAGGSAGVAFNKGAGLIQQKQERNQYARQAGQAVTGAGNTQELIDQAYALEGDSKAVKNIQAQADKVSSLSAKQGTGNRFSNWVNDKRTTKAAGKLYTSMQENNISRVASAEETEIKTALSKAYAEKIKADVNDKSVSKVVDALYKSEYTNEPLSRSEQRMISSDNAKAALSDVQSNNDVIRSQINRAQRRATEDIASTAALTGTKEQATEKPAKIDIDDFNLSDDGKTYTADGGEQVDIKSISSVDADDIRVELSNGNTESVKALDLGSEDQAVVYQGIMDIQTRLGAPVTASFANTVVNEYNQAKASDANLSTTDFIYGVEEAVRKGYMNDNGGNYAVNLSESAREALFDEGRKIAQEHTKAQQKSVQSRIKGDNSQRKGTVTYEDGIERSQLNERQQVGVDVVTHIAEETGIDVVFFRSIKDGKGRYSSNFITENGFSENGQAPNGFWHNGKMYIDVNAGMNGEGLILFTAAHEIVHMIREGSPESFKALADFLVENYAKKGVDVNKLVLKEMTRSTNLNYDQAFEEVIAQSCESFLRDIHLSDKAEQLYKTDKGLATKIKNILNRILNALKKWYGVVKPQSVEANYVLEMKDALSEIYDRYIAGIRAASENLRNMEKPADEGGVKLQGRGSTTFNDNDNSESKEILRITEENISKVSDKQIFNIDKDFVFKTNNKSNDIFDYFTSLGGIAVNPQYGIVELSKSGSKSTVFHGFGREKLASIYGIKDTIENGTVISYTQNYKNKGYDRFIVCGKGTLFGNKETYLSVVIKSYPNNKKLNNKFYLHEVLLMESTKETDSPIMTGTQNSENPVSESVSKNNISQSDTNINTSTQKNQSRSDTDYITEDKTARWTDKRIDALYGDYASSSPNYSKAYAAYISPEDFLNLTTTNPERIIQQSRELDAEELADYRQPIYLAYDPDSLSSRVVGHEGRHRMAALMAAGIKKVPIAIQFYGETNKYNRQPIDVLHLRGQEFSAGKAKGNIMLRDLVPISKAYRAEIEKKFGVNGKESVKFSSRNTQLDADYLSAVKRGDMETAQRMVDEAAKAAGYTVKGYHQTARDFTVFNTNNPQAGLNDSETPNGIFFKTNDHDIGLEGKKQMAGYLYVGNVLEFKDRAEANNWYRKNIDGYETLDNAKNSEVEKIEDRMTAIETDMFRDGITDEQYEALDTEWNSLLEEMRSVEDDYRGKLRSLLNDYFLTGTSGYDSIHLGYDGHRYVEGKREDVETYVIFKNTQVKSADPVTYDDNGDVIPLSERFNENNKDIRFSLRDTIEQTDRLIAWHNMSVDGLMGALELGGLAMPSWAIKTANNPHSSYGEVSVIAPRELVDPKTNRNSMVFGGDAWTPVFPEVNYKVTYESAEKLKKEIVDLVGEKIYKQIGGASLDPDNISEQFKRNGGALPNYYRDNLLLRYAYLKSIGKDIEVPTKDEELYGTEFSNDAVKRFSYNLIGGKSAANRLLNMPASELMEQHDIKQAIADLRAEEYREKLGEGDKLYLMLEKDGLFDADHVSFREVEGMLRAARKYLDRGVKQMVDKKALSETVEKEINSTDYEKWIKNKLEKTIIRKGIRNNKDIFTPSGKRRSFESLNYEYTLANVVKAMKSQPKQGRAQFLSGPGSVKGAALKNYADIEQVRADRGRLVADEESGKDAYEAYNKNLEDILDRMSINTDRFDTADAVIEILQHAKTENGIYNYMQRELKGWYNVSHELAHDIYELIGQINKLPMEYFEGKTYDAVTFNQVAGVVVPDSIDSDLKNQLINAGANVIEYKAGDNEDRLIKVNSIEKAKFQSRENNSYYGFTDDAFDIDFGEDDSVENLIAREFVTHHEDIGEVLRNVADIELTPKKVESIVNRVIRDNLGRLDAEARHTLSIELQMALERVNVDDPQTVSDNIIGAVRKAIEGSTVVDDKAVSDYNQLRDAFKGKKFYLTDEQINQLKEHNMTLDSYRRAMFGKVTIVKRENAKRSINGGYTDAHELSLESLHDILESPDEVLGFRSWEWDEKGYDAPNIIKKAFETLRDRREQPITNVYSDEAIDERAVAIAAKITGGIVEAKYNSKQNPYATKLVADLKQKRTEAVNKQKEKNRQKLADLKQKERERAEKREQDIRQKYREQRARGYENRKRTELRGKIRKLMNSFQSRLTKPHDGSYVPRELISQTVEILNSINMDTGRSTRLSEKIAVLKTTYDKLQKDNLAYAVYDDTISDMLQNLSDTLSGIAIMDMSLDQLKMTYDTLRSLDHYIRESVRMTATDEKRTAHQLGREMIAETKDVPKEHSGLLSGYVQSQLRADVMFNRLAGFKKNSTWSQMARMLNDGQLHMTQLQMEFSRIFADVLTDTKQLRTLSDTKHLVDIGLVDDDGNKVPITRGMMLSLYMHLLNEDNMRHVERGGLTIPSMKEYYKGDLAKAFGSGQRSVRVGMIDFSQYAEGIKTVIEEQLTDYEIEWIEKAHEFFDGASREALNDTTMKLYHFKKANVDNYFPIHTDSNYRAASFESITRDMSLENSGFMKERIKASNPILLEDIVDVINDQIQKVSKYCGLTIPIKNFQKVYGTTLAGFETSLQKEINKKFSGSRSNTSATKYIDNLITDLTSGRQTSDGPFAKFFSVARGNLAAATLTLNVRVAIAQAASYPTAAAEIGWKPLLKAFVKGGKNNRMISGADRAYIEEHTPLLWLRTQGYSNTEIGDIKEIRKQRHQIEGKFKKALGWIEFFDGMTVGRLFYAAQYYVDEQFPTLKRGSEEYKQKVAEVYNDVIEKTQPNYTTMQRPDILRNPNALVKSMTMFMTQRLQNFNIVYDAVGTYNKYRKDLTAGKNGVTAQDLRQAKTKLRRALVSQTVAALTIVGMKLFADMLMHSMNAYRDDDDELTAESVSLALLNNFADTIFGSVLFGSDLYSLLKSAVNKEMYYGISLSGVDSLKDVLTAIANIWKKGINHDTANKAATTICQLMGIPLNNAEKIGKAIYNWGSDFSSGSFMEAGVDRTNKQNVHRAEMRYTSGDTAGAQELLTAMIEQKKAEGKTDKEAKSWLRSQLTSTYKPRYVQAVKDNNTEERTAIRQFLYQSGAYGSLTDLDKSLSKWVDK